MHAAYTIDRKKMSDSSNPIPSVFGEIIPTPTGSRQAGGWSVVVTCPYCGSQHTHSAPKGSGIDPGFRIAHCRLDRQGYLITVRKN
jgi:hypothetical protein